MAEKCKKQQQNTSNLSTIHRQKLAAHKFKELFRGLYLQQHYAIHGNVPPKETLFGKVRSLELRDAVLLQHDNGTSEQSAPWPQADYIVGNPPFVGGSPLRKRGVKPLGTHTPPLCVKPIPTLLPVPIMSCFGGIVLQN